MYKKYVYFFSITDSQTDWQTKQIIYWRMINIKENIHTQKCNTLSWIAAMKFSFPLFLTDGQFSIYREALQILNTFINTQKYIYIYRIVL